MDTRRDASARSTYTKDVCIESADAKGASTDGAGIESVDIRSTFARGTFFAWDASIKTAGIEDVSTKGACIGDTSSCAGDACTEGTYARNTCVGDVGIGDTSTATTKGTGGADILKDLRIYLRWSWILELKWYSPALETGVAAG